jgi:TPR repeat protein
VNSLLASLLKRSTPDGARPLPRLRDIDKAETPGLIHRYRVRAEQGDANACKDLGLAYTLGAAGLPADTAAAEEWFRRAAAADEPVSLFFVARHFTQGEKAWQLLVRSAEAGCADAQQEAARAYRLGTFNGYTGMGVKPHLSLQWAQLAASKAQGRCGYELGWHHAHGVGTERDGHAAVEALCKAAAAAQPPKMHAKEVLRAVTVACVDKLLDEAVAGDRDARVALGRVINAAGSHDAAAAETVDAQAVL